MAILHQATLAPTKLELLAAWLPRQPWLDGADVSELTTVGRYRLDDPGGEVGVGLTRAVTPTATHFKLPR